jgi:hypothetical protein
VLHGVLRFNGMRPRRLAARIQIRRSLHGPKVIAQPGSRGKRGGDTNGGRAVATWPKDKPPQAARNGTCSSGDPQPEKQRGGLVGCNRGNRSSICMNRATGMIAKFHILAAALTGILLCSLAGAQSRAGAVSARPSGVRVRPSARISAGTIRPVSAAIPSNQQASIIRVSPSGQVTAGFSTFPNSFSFDDDLGVPGLGFDYPHLAAINSALRNSSSGFRHHEHFGQGSFVPILFGGYPYYYGDLGYEYEQPPQQPPAQAQPQIIIIQQPVPAQTGAGAGSGGVNYSAPSPAPEAAAPVRDVGEFILVRRDGRVLFASMYLISGTQLTYVTPEGIRRTLALADLDANATQQMNEARGTTVQLHN